jgi:hypothetical protein
MQLIQDAAGELSEAHWRRLSFQLTKTTQDEVNPTVGLTGFDRGHAGGDEEASGLGRSPPLSLLRSRKVVGGGLSEFSIRHALVGEPQERERTHQRQPPAKPA